MPETIVLDQLVAGHMAISKSGSDPPEVRVFYVMKDAAGTYSREKYFPYVPTPAEQTTLNNFIAKLIGLIQAAEGI